MAGFINLSVAVIKSRFLIGIFSLNSAKEKLSESLVPAVLCASSKKARSNVKLAISTAWRRAPRD